MAWHETHKTRMSDSSHFDVVCDECGATDGKGHEYLMKAPCGLPDVREFDKLRHVADKKFLYKLVYNGYDNTGVWLSFIKIIAEITYKPGWYFRVGFDANRLWFQVGVTEEAEISFDPIAGKKVPWRGAKHYMSPHMCRNEIVSMVHHAIERAELHEVNEWFRYKGASIFNPHLDPDALVEVARFLKNFDTRDNAMTMEEPE